MKYGVWKWKGGQGNRFLNYVGRRWLRWSPNIFIYTCYKQATPMESITLFALAL
jgi:hypothetical protein